MAKYPTNIFVDFIDRTLVNMYEKTFGIQYSLLLDNMDSHNEKTVTVVLLHPGRAEQFQSDPMMNQMLRFLSKEDFQNIEFVSLFPFRASTTNDLRDLIIEEELSDIIEINSKIIQKKFEKSNAIVLSWGDRPHYVPVLKFNAAVRFMEQLLKQENFKNKSFLFNYSHSFAWTEKGNPDTPAKKVIDALIAYEKISEKQPNE